MDITPELMRSIKAPTIMLLGERDFVVSNEKNVEMFNCLSAVDKCLVTIKEATHFPFHEKSNANLLIDEVTRFFSRI